MKARDSANRPAGAADFDFLLGSWNVRHRKLVDRLVGSNEWLEFGGTMEAGPILGGLGNFDRNVIRQPGDEYEASTLRLFNPKERRWSLHWIDGRNPQIDPPLFGCFENGLGTFYGTDTCGNQLIINRFLWRSACEDCASWEQAFSTDEGQSWETNWTMEFTRA